MQIITINDDSSRTGVVELRYIQYMNLVFEHFSKQWREYCLSFFVHDSQQELQEWCSERSCVRRLAAITHLHYTGGCGISRSEISSSGTSVHGAIDVRVGKSSDPVLACMHVLALTNCLGLIGDGRLLYTRLQW